MSYSVMFALLLLTPLLFSLLCFACRKRGHSATRTVTVLHSLGITLLLILALWVVQTAADAGEIFAAGLWLHIDGLGGLFLAILGVIGFLTGVYSIVMKWLTASFHPLRCAITTVSSICFCSPCCWLLPAIT